MKFRYLIPSFIIAALTLFVSCTDDNAPTYLDEVQLSSSYVAIPQEGGSVAVDVTAIADWTIDGESIPEWLTVSPASGSAGAGKITFSAESTLESRSIELLLNCGGKVQRINVVQQAEETDPVIYTVAEAVAMIKAGTQPETAVYVKGIVCRIQEISVQYGNATYFISDDGTYGDGNWLEIYRGYWFNGGKFTKGDEFGVGDELVVKGVLINYNGTPETNQGTAEVISIKKSLIGIDGVELLEVEDGTGVTEFPLDGGSIRVNVNSKGNGFRVSIPQEAKSWLHIADFGPGYVTLEADANTGGDRNVTVGFSTESEGITYTCQQSFTQKGAIVAATVAEFLAAPENSTQYRLTGVITSMYASDKQGKSFTIADYTGSVLIYRAEGFIESGAKVGDVVTVVGVRTSYKETPQMGTTTFEELNYAVTEVSIAEFLAKPVANNVYYMVSGKIKDIANASYGNMTIEDETGEVYVYGCYPGWGATGDFRKGLVEKLGLEAGDKVTVIGTRAAYTDKNTGVTTQQVGNGVYFSHEKAE